MYCNKCGKDNADDAVYCQKCGQILFAEEETRVARRTNGEISGDVTKIFSITPTLMFVKLGYVLAILGAFLLVALFSTVLSPFVGIWPGVILGLALLLIPAFYHFRQKLKRYTLTETTIEIDAGLISRTTQNVPLRRVQDVTVSSSVFQRMLGYGDIVIDNASETGGKVILDNIDAPREHADQILRQMRLLDR
ncbi:MAG TPA: PH domain-containing protein [Pyrinomonadaceae bacterium]|nr:PH domain-containing protein [Pyrinomonadaceae bacterium]